MSWTHLSNYRLICDAFCLRLVTKYHREIKRVYNQILISLYRFKTVRNVSVAATTLKQKVNIYEISDQDAHICLPRIVVPRVKGTPTGNSFSHEVKCA